MTTITNDSRRMSNGHSSNHNKAHGGAAKNYNDMNIKVPGYQQGNIKMADAENMILSSKSSDENGKRNGVADVKAQSKTPLPPAHMVGNSFVSQYYTVLHRNPKHLYRFYTDASVLTHADCTRAMPGLVQSDSSDSRDPIEGSGLVETVEGQADIHNKVMKLGLDEARAEIVSVDSQYSLQDGILVQVTGYLINKDKVKRAFVQTFFLAVQEKGFYVRNDVFRYIDMFGKDSVSKHNASSSSDAVANNMTNFAVAGSDAASVGKDPSISTQVSNGVQVASNSTDIEAEAHMSQKKSETGTFSSDKDKEEKNTRDDVVSEIETIAKKSGSRKIEGSTQKKNHRGIENAEEDSDEIEEEEEEEEEEETSNSGPQTYAMMVKKLRSKSLQALEKKMKDSGSDNKEHGQKASKISGSLRSSNVEGTQGQTGGTGTPRDTPCTSIFIRNLPNAIDESAIEQVFSRFGAIKGGLSGVNLKVQKSGCYAFVEYEEASTVRNVLSSADSAPIEIWGNSVSVEEKKPIILKDKGERSNRKDRDRKGSVSSSANGSDSGESSRQGGSKRGSDKSTQGGGSSSKGGSNGAWGKGTKSNGGESGARGGASGDKQHGKQSQHQRKK